MAFLFFDFFLEVGDLGEQVSTVCVGSMSMEKTSPLRFLILTFIDILNINNLALLPTHKKPLNRQD